MNRNQHSDEFREQALSKVRHRGTRSVRDIAEELNMSAGTHSLEVINSVRGGAFINLDFPEDRFNLPVDANGEGS